MTVKSTMYPRLPIVLACVLTFGGPVFGAVPVGSVVIYSDGKVEKLLSNRNGLLTWEDDQKRTDVRSVNPVMPVIERRDFLSGKGYKQVVNSGNPDSILTLPSGTRVGFSLTRMKHNGGRIKRNWECVHQGQSEKKIAGSVRQLDNYRCERFVFHSKDWTRLFRETRTFSYSPELGLVTKLKRKTRKSSSKRKLVTVIPPEKANYKRLSKKVRKIRAPKPSKVAK